MRRAILVAAIAVVAVMAVPTVAAAAKEKRLKANAGGSCEIQGLATELEKEGKPLPFFPPVKGYKFKFKGKGECKNQKVETWNSGTAKYELTEEGNFAVVSAEVNTAAKVTANLSCAESNSEVRAKGVLNVKKGEEPEREFKFTLSFKTKEFGVLEVGLWTEVGEEETAKGTASFTKPGTEKEKLETLLKCVKSEVTELPFAAVVNEAGAAGGPWVGE